MKKKILCVMACLCLSGILAGCGDTVAVNNSVESQAVPTDEPSLESIIAKELTEESVVEPEVAEPTPEPTPDPNEAWLNEVSYYSVRPIDAGELVYVRVKDSFEEDASFSNSIWQLILPGDICLDLESAVFAERHAVLRFTPLKGETGDEEWYRNTDRILRVTSLDGQCSYEYEYDRRKKLIENFEERSSSAKVGSIIILNGIFYVVNDVNITYDVNTCLYTFQFTMENFSGKPSMEKNFMYFVLEQYNREDNSWSVAEDFTMNIAINYQEGYELKFNEYGDTEADFGTVTITVSGTHNIPDGVEDKDEYISKLLAGKIRIVRLNHEVKLINRPNENWYISL